MQSKLAIRYCLTRDAINCAPQALEAPDDYMDRFEGLTNPLVVTLLNAADAAWVAERMEVHGHDGRAQKWREEAQAAYDEAMGDEDAIRAIMQRARQAVAGS